MNLASAQFTYAGVAAIPHLALNHCGSFEQRGTCLRQAGFAKANHGACNADGGYRALRGIQDESRYAKRSQHALLVIDRVACVPYLLQFRLGVFT
jgi:hypothetical protein